VASIRWRIGTGCHCLNPILNPLSNVVAYVNELDTGFLAGCAFPDEFPAHFDPLGRSGKAKTHLRINSSNEHLRSLHGKSTLAYIENQAAIALF
jgi:hypothetical protein